MRGDEPAPSCRIGPVAVQGNQGTERSDRGVAVILYCCFIALEPEPRQMLQPQEPGQFPSQDYRDGDEKRADKDNSKPPEPADPREKRANKGIQGQGQPERDQPSAARKRHDAPTDATPRRVRDGVDCAVGVCFILQRLECRFRGPFADWVIGAEYAGPAPPP